MAALAHQLGVNIFSRIPAFGHGRHCQVITAAGAITTGPNTIYRGAPGSINADLPAGQFGQVTGL